jgi:citrate lyase synthetase
VIRALTHSDLTQLERLHSLHFKNEFDLPDFMTYVCAFVVEDQEGIITAGGIRDIAECVLVTDLNRDPRVRISALYKMLDATRFVCQKSGYDQMYVWSQNPRYTRRLRRNGFRPPQGESLILDL